ncbi:MAG: hypothetical protein E6H03_11490 [Bacillati bacterium ANGP1]|uniref:Uncharacterized protein n=1 Tax=Candidatus Segetimicrobium genomatis TaxID=2569760 RepID=A0A537J5E9_9BACT|nr:MAG: hypothetical protein E6H03_11490 [Terrabacteria group bacterium ANGP1]
MRVFLAILGGAMMIVGAIWFLQGIRILPGSFMTGSTFWAVGGAIVALGGLAILRAVRAGAPQSA